MCGIAGFWQHDQLKDSASNTVERMLTQIEHRGPDGYGQHCDRSRGLAMGHARLSIIDLHTGDQPLYAHNQEHVLTVNGEFYDYKRIRTRLMLDGARFVTKSDSEIALHLYERYGLNFVDHLRGEFAFVLFDKTRERLILVRDRFGIKPLFFHVQPQAIYYASEMKSLFAHEGVPREFSKEGVLNQLMHTMVPGTTLFQGIHAVQPGTMLIIDRTKTGFDIKESRYWDMRFPKQEQRREDQPDTHYIKGVQRTLSDAVQFRLEADVPVGCYLSGGIDSCSMLGLASSMQQSSVKAFTISFDHAAYDEAAIATEMAQRVGADQEILNLSADALYGDNYVRTLWHAERTFYNTLGVAKWCMSRRVHECGYRVVVTGEGADELFGGYPAFKRDMLRFGMQETHSPAEVASYQKLLEKSNQLFKGAILAEEPMSHPGFERLCGFTPSWIQPWMQTLEIARPLLHDDVLDSLKDYDPVDAIVQKIDPEMIRGRHYLDKAQYTWIKTMLECQILNWGGDRVDMANSMESRPAFLDHHVAEFAATIPPHLRINGNVEKWVLREAMKNILPEVLYKREKFAFMAPPGHTEEKKQNALSQLLDQYLNPDHIRRVGMFDPKRVAEFLKEYQEDRDAVSLTRKDALLNHLLGLHILHEQFIASTVPSL